MAVNSQWMWCCSRVWDVVCLRGEGAAEAGAAVEGAGEGAAEEEDVVVTGLSCISSRCS